MLKCIVFAIILASLLVMVHGDLQLEIQVHYPSRNLPSNSQLYLRGDSLGLNWDTGVQLNNSDTDNNLWTYTVTYPDNKIGSRFSVKILVDDQIWQIGHNTQVVLPSVSSTVNAYPFFYSNSGSYTYIRRVFSPQLKNYRSLVIYTPPSYHENTLKVYPNVLVMHDGQNLFNESTAFGGVDWDCEGTVDQLINKAAMDEIVIIGVDNTADRINELTYSYDATTGAGGKGDYYLDFIEQTVIPTVTEQYRIKVNPKTLGILGSSLGGLISCYAGWTRNKVYGRAGCMSSSFWWNNEDFNNVIMNKYTPPSNLTVYLDSGDAGQSNDDVTQTQRVREHFIQDGWQSQQNLFYYLDHGGQHSEYFWGKRFWIPMTSLYPPSDATTTPV